jgi:hypothetical protein
MDVCFGLLQLNNVITLFLERIVHQLYCERQVYVELTLDKLHRWNANILDFHKANYVILNNILLY